jgi:pimeloyl-ACP methyl ester carboxylesterase
MTVVRVGTATAPEGAVLHWRAQGEGKVALLASNGIGISTFFWRHLGQYFAGTHTFVTWDYRGHGLSPVPQGPEDLTIALCARDLFTVLDRAGFQEAVLLGHSMGSQVILEAYRSHFQRVLALVPILGAAAFPERASSSRWRGSSSRSALKSRSWPSRRCGRSCARRACGRR